MIERVDCPMCHGSYVFVNPGWACRIVGRDSDGNLVLHTPSGRSHEETAMSKATEFKCFCGYTWSETSKPWRVLTQA